MTKKIIKSRSLSGNKKIQAIATLSGSISHELKNYLAAIGVCAELAEVKLRDIRNTIKSADYLISNLYSQIKGVMADQPETKDFRCYSMAKNIKETLQQYPFKPGEYKLIIVETGKIRDFEYFGNPILTNHILSNLIKNSLNAIQNGERTIRTRKTQKASKNKITIKLESSRNFNKLIFKDTATGISKKFLPKIFDLFATKAQSQSNSGIGLSFCKMVMNSYDGDIVCNSVEGEYTEFTLKFPKVVEHWIDSRCIN